MAELPEHLQMFQMKGLYHAADVRWPNETSCYVRITPPILLGDLALRSAGESLGLPPAEHVATSLGNDETGGGSIYIFRNEGGTEKDLQVVSDIVVNALLNFADATVYPGVFNGLK